MSGIHVAGAAHAAHDLVEDQQHAVAVADLAQALQVTGDRRGGAEAGAGHRLGDEGGDILRPQLADRGVELVGDADAVLLGALIGAAVAVFVAVRNMLDLGQQRFVGGAAGNILAERQRRKRVAVIGALAGDEELARGLAALEVVLPRELDGAFDRFRAAGDEEGAIETVGRLLDQARGEVLHRRRGEEQGVAVGELGRLFGDRLDHLRMRMTEAGDGRTTRGVEIALAGAVDDIGALAFHRDGQALLQVAVQYV
jgi:hypothetical protein